MTASAAIPYALTFYPMKYHPKIEEYDFSDIPLDFDLFLYDEEVLDDYIPWLINSFNGDTSKPPGICYFCHAKAVFDKSIYLKVTANFVDRCHSISTFLPKSAFRTCVGSEAYDEKPHLFVESNWFTSIKEKEFSFFGLFDAIGVKSKLISGEISKESLQELELRIDQISTNHPNVVFFGFADSILLKCEWALRNQKTHYKPEVLLQVYEDLRAAFKEILGVNSYMVLTQGENISGNRELFRKGGADNYYSLNSLGIPFAEIKAIEQAAKRNIKKGIHPGVDIYMDEDFYFSLFSDFKSSQAQRERREIYDPIFPMEEPPSYYWNRLEDLIKK